LHDPRRGSEEDLIARLRAGERAAFAGLVDGLQGRLLAFAGTFTSSPALAEDIVQETWLAVIRGLPAFEGRSSLRTWIFSILVRRARTLATRESRRAAGTNGADPAEAEWDMGRGRHGLWDSAPVPWGLEDPAALFQTYEALEVVRAAVAALPEAQRQAVLLRDVEDLPATDVCNILGISETNQRVLLHRGRSRIRRALDRYVREDGGGSVRERAALGSAPGARSAFSTEDP
jgi:RNA polymerase sigma-70 factor, ECF subfamily